MCVSVHRVGLNSYVCDAVTHFSGYFNSLCTYSTLVLQINAEMP